MPKASGFYLQRTCTLHVQGSFIGVVVAVLMTPGVFAANSVVVESKTVLPGAMGVVVNVFIENDADLVVLQLPIEFRTTSGSAFTANSFDFSPVAGGRVSASGLMESRVRMYFPEPMLVSDPLQCGGDTVGTYRGNDGEATPINFYTSPDGLLWQGLTVTNRYLPAGSDGSTPSFSFVFDVNSSAGVFEIDTCCVDPVNHLVFINPPFQFVIPEFTKGVITIPLCPVNCGGAGELPDRSPCDCHADPQCDGVCNVLDVVTSVGVAFRGLEAPVDHECSVVRTDADCDNDTDVFDVVRFVNVAFRNQPPENNFCDPTAP